MACARIETFGISKKFTDSVIREMTGARKNPLFHHPWIRTDLEHVQIMIGFEDQAIRFTQMNLYKFGHIAEVGTDRYFCAVAAKCESDGVSGVMRNGKRVHVDIADREMLPGLNGLHAAQALAESLRKNTLQLRHGRLGHIQRRLPKPEHLRQTVAMIAVFVGDQNRVEVIKFRTYRREPSECFAFAEPGVYKDAGVLGFEQRQIARTPGRQNGDAQADENAPRGRLRPQTAEIMADRTNSVNAREESIEENYSASLDGKNSGNSCALLNFGGKQIAGEAAGEQGEGPSPKPCQLLCDGQTG